jgi:Glycosyltransferase family 92
MMPDQFPNRLWLLLALYCTLAANLWFIWTHILSSCLVENLINDQICVMTRVQSEHRFFHCMLLEWIEYHLQLGVDHFYITDDCSPAEHALQHTLQPYIDAGLVTALTSYGDHRNCSQQIHENDLFSNMFKSHARASCEWVANMDIDEVSLQLSLQSQRRRARHVYSHCSATASALCYMQFVTLWAYNGTETLRNVVSSQQNTGFIRQA